MPFDWNPETQTDKVPVFGVLPPTEMLYEFDHEPLLYVSKTFRGLDVLCYKTDSDDTHSQYIVSPTNGDIISRLANGNMSLRSAVHQPWLWIAEVANDSFGVRATWTLSPASLPESILPKSGRSLYNSGSIILETPEKGIEKMPRIG